MVPEWATWAQDRHEELVNERFEMFTSILLQTFSQVPNEQQRQNTYEEMVRVLMGQEAYLLFIFDRLIIAVSVAKSIMFLCLDFEEYSELPTK